MDEKELESIREHLEWAKDNLESPLDNLEVSQVEWLIEQAEKLKAISDAWVRIEESETESSSGFYGEVQDIFTGEE